MFRCHVFFDTFEAGNIRTVEHAEKSLASDLVDYAIGAVDQNVSKLNFAESNRLGITMTYFDKDDLYFEASAIVELIKSDDKVAYKCQFWETGGAMEEKIVYDEGACGDYLYFSVKRWSVLVKNK